jgi:hypothetical protein
LSAGQGKKFREAMKRLKTGDKVLAYLKGKGYVGYGEVTSSAIMVKDFEIADGTKLLEKPLKQPNISENKDNPDMADWAVGINWFKSLPRENAITQSGIFANQNVVCKLKHQPTIDFLTPHYSL